MCTKSLMATLLILAACGDIPCGTLTPRADQPLLCHSPDLLSWCASEPGCTITIDFQTTRGAVVQCASLAKIIDIDTPAAHTQLHYGPRGTLIGGVREVKRGVGYVYDFTFKTACKTTLETAGYPLL